MLAEDDEVIQALSALMACLTSSMEPFARVRIRSGAVRVAVVESASSEPRCFLNPPPRHDWRGSCICCPRDRADQCTSRGSRRQLERTMLLIVVLVLFALALGGGGWGHSRYGYASWSPAGIIVLVLLVMLLTGNLHVCGHGAGDGEQSSSL